MYHISKCSKQIRIRWQMKWMVCVTKIEEIIVIYNYNEMIKWNVKCIEILNKSGIKENENI